MTDAVRTLGVVGAGTMGAGIAQLGCLAGMETFLHDPFAEALERGVETVRSGLRKGAERGRWSADEASEAERRLKPVDDIEELSSISLAIEAVPERADLKRELFARLSQICAAEVVLATNTSSILVSSIASAAKHPERVVGMHFFNPPPLMRLLEVVAATQTDEHALAVARAAGEAMGKQVIVVTDGPGFLVNRCGRPFYSEALRSLQERVATVEQIDRICRLGGGFRMGPFELMDLVGIDVGYEVAQSFDAQSFGEPRWKPNPLQARMAAAGRLGRKTGRGWYSYDQGRHRPDDPDPPPRGAPSGARVAIDGTGPVAAGLRQLAGEAGFETGEPGDFTASAPPDLLVDAAVPARVSDLGTAAGGPPLAVLCAETSLALRGTPAACGFHLLPPLDSTRLVELTRLASTPAETAEATEGFFRALGLHVEWVGDAPGLVLGRIVCQLVNEAAFAVGEGVGSADDVDTGLTLGLNHPRGPVEWSRAIGLDHALATVDGLWEERHEGRYRAAPLLRRSVALGEALG
jgi:3-hydroxybutyryl-CoA dehydrogenase